MTLERIALGGIDLDRLRLWQEKVSWRRGEDHSRWVFLSPGAEAPRLVYKVWNPSYVRATTILAGIESGLYGPDVTPALRALIVERGVCRGYVMEFWKPNRRIAPDFARALWARTLASGHCACQYRVSHTVRRGDAVSLIDLEAVYPVAAFAGPAAAPAEIEDPDYRRLVEALASRTVKAGEVERLAWEHARRHAPGAPRAGPGWVGRKLNGLGRRLARHAKTVLPDARSRIER